MKLMLVAAVVAFSTGASAYDVTSTEGRRHNLLDYVDARDDLNASDKAQWLKATRRQFGGKALVDGLDEGVTAAKSVISGAIFFSVAPKVAVKAAYDAYYDTNRWVPPPIAINYQLLAFQGRKPKTSARQLAFDFPRHFNEEMAFDLVQWWQETLKKGAIGADEASRVRATLKETLPLMRPMLLTLLRRGSELEVAPGSGAALKQMRSELKVFAGVGRAAILRDADAPLYDKYRALAKELGTKILPRPTAGQPKQSASQPIAKAPKALSKTESVAAVTPVAPVRPKAGWRQRLDRVVDKWLGTPYLFGGINRKGVDCSAFSRAVIREALSIELPRNSRAQARMGTKVSQKALRPGDLIFFDTLDRGRITHVGVFMGTEKFAHASSSKGVTRAVLGKRYYQRAYRGARRLSH